MFMYAISCADCWHHPRDADRCGIHLPHAAPDAVGPGSDHRRRQCQTEQVAEIRSRLGLDQPMMTQFVIWSGRMGTGDFGECFFFKKPVAELIGERSEPRCRWPSSRRDRDVLAIPLGVMRRTGTAAGSTAS